MKQRFFYFLYVVGQGDEIEIRTPTGGITVVASNPEEAYDLAFRKARKRFAIRPTEVAVLMPQRTRAARRQVEMLEAAKRQRDNRFELAMRG